MQLQRRRHPRPAPAIRGPLRGWHLTCRQAARCASPPSRVCSLHPLLAPYGSLAERDDARHRIAHRLCLALSQDHPTTGRLFRLMRLAALHDHLEHRVPMRFGDDGNEQVHRLVLTTSVSGPAGLTPALVNVAQPRWMNGYLRRRTRSRRLMGVSISNFCRTAW